jgi:hypothetical protein
MYTYWSLVNEKESFQLESRNKGVDTYLIVAEAMHKSDSEFQLDFFTKMGQRNSQIEESAKKDELATHEYLKVGQKRPILNFALISKLFFKRICPPGVNFVPWG